MTRHDTDRARRRRLPDRHHHRVLRLLHLRHRRRAGVPETVLPRGQPVPRDRARVRHLRRRLHRPPPADLHGRRDRHGRADLPGVRLFNTGNFTLMLTGHVLIFGIALSLAGGPTAAMLSEMFGSRIGYTGASVGYQLAGVFGAALSPIIAASLFEIFKSGYAIAI